MNDLKALTGVAAGYSHIAVESCGSTFLVCYEEAAKGNVDRLWVTAGEQTQGRGSRGRNWISKPGNLYSSLLLRNPSKPKNYAELTFVAALAVRDTIADFLAGALVQLKWPNDVLVNDKKCSGVLLESRMGGASNLVVIGMGINCRHHPSDTLFPATDMLAEGIDVQPEDVFAVLSGKLAQMIEIWDQGNNFQGVLDAWLHHAWGLGKATKVGLYDGSHLSGTFKGVDKRGQMLLVEDNGDERVITVGDIFTLPGAGKNAGEQD